MDKYEYNLKLEEIDKLVDQGTMKRLPSWPIPLTGDAFGM